MKAGILFCGLAALALAAGQAGAAPTVYASTSSGHGELYILNTATGGAQQDIGPLNDAASVNYSVSGLAFDPNSGVLYGATGTKSGTLLLTINPVTARVTVVGSFGIGGTTMTDLSFDPSGNLYGVSSTGGANLYSINKLTGAATQVGSSGVSFTEGGGLAISSGDVFYATPIPGEYGTYNPTTGAYTHIATPATPAGNGTNSAYAGLAFAGNTLYGINLLAGSAGAGATHLVTIDPTTGNVTDIGPSIAHLDAVAASVPEPGAVTLLLGGGVIGLVAGRRKRATRR